jgi:hypothetical protein
MKLRDYRRELGAWILTVALALCAMALTALTGAGGWP